MTPPRSAFRRPLKGKKSDGTKNVDQSSSTAKNLDRFVPLASLKQVAPEPAVLLDQIRAIYFNTTKETIHADLAHALELLKDLPSEKAREKAAVYMEGLAQMRRDWIRNAQN